MDDQISGVTTSTDAGSSSPSSDVASSSAGVQSENTQSAQVDPFHQFAQEARAANIADTSAEAQPAPRAEVQAETKDEGDSATPEGFQLPENDDDLKLITDATAKAHIEGQRQHIRGTLEPKAKQHDAWQAAFQANGIEPHHIEPIAKVSGGLLATKQVQVQGEDGQMVMENYMTTEPFWQNLQELSTDHLSQALWDAAKMYPDYLAQQMPQESLFQALGLNPALADVYSQVREDGTLNGLAPASSADAVTLNTIPAELHATYKEIAQADPELADELKWNLTGEGGSPRFALQHLKIEQRQRESDAKERAATDAATKERAERRETAAKERVTSFSNDQGRAFMDDLAKNYLPYGKGETAKTDNEWVHNNIFRAVKDGLREDPKGSRLLDGLTDALKRGNQLAVTQIMTQLDVIKTRLRNAEIERYDRNLRATIANEQRQRDASAKLQSVNSMGGFSEDTRGNRLANPENLNDPANFLAIAARHRLHLSE